MMESGRRQPILREDECWEGKGRAARSAAPQQAHQVSPAHGPFARRSQQRALPTLVRRCGDAPRMQMQNYCSPGTKAPMCLLPAYDRAPYRTDKKARSTRHRTTSETGAPKTAGLLSSRPGVQAGRQAGQLCGLVTHHLRCCVGRATTTAAWPTLRRANVCLRQLDRRVPILEPGAHVPLQSDGQDGDQRGHHGRAKQLGLADCADSPNTLGEQKEQAGLMSVCAGCFRRLDRLGSVGRV